MAESEWNLGFPAGDAAGNNVEWHLGLPYGIYYPSESEEHFGEFDLAVASAINGEGEKKAQVGFSIVSLLAADIEKEKKAYSNQALFIHPSYTAAQNSKKATGQFFASHNQIADGEGNRKAIASAVLESIAVLENIAAKNTAGAVLFIHDSNADIAGIKKFGQPILIGVTVGNAAAGVKSARQNIVVMISVDLLTQISTAKFSDTANVSTLANVLGTIRKQSTGQFDTSAAIAVLSQTQKHLYVSWAEELATEVISHGIKQTNQQMVLLVSPDVQAMLADKCVTVDAVLLSSADLDAAGVVVKVVINLQSRFAKIITGGSSKDSSVADSSNLTKEISDYSELTRNINKISRRKV